MHLDISLNTSNCDSRSLNFQAIGVSLTRYFRLGNYQNLRKVSELKPVFSDGFNDGERASYPGNCPFCEAVDLRFWQTGDFEWYDLAAVTTKDGALGITLSKKETHDLNYEGGTISGLNQVCFTGGYIEVAMTFAWSQWLLDCGSLNGQRATSEGPGMVSTWRQWCVS